MSDLCVLEKSKHLAFKPAHARMSMEELADYDLPTIELTPTAQGLKHGYFQSHAWTSGEFRFVDAKTTCILSCCRNSRHTQDIGEMVFITRYYEGGIKGYSKDQIIDRQPGFIYLMDGEMCWEGVQESGTVHTVNLPKSLLGYDSDKHSGFLTIDLSSSLGRCLDAVLNKLYCGFSNEHLDVAPSVLSELVSCTKIALGTSAQCGDVRAHARAALYRVICNFIESNLHNPDLSTMTILKTFGVSRASLYRMFDGQGGVRRYITERRALHAVVDLSNGTGRRGYVKEVSERWGFATPGDFNRTIRRLYDQSPGALFAA